MRLQAESVPNTHHCALGQPHLFGQRARTPVCRRWRRTLQRAGYRFFHLGVGDLTRSPWPRLVRQAFQTIDAKPLSPLPHRRAGDIQLASNLLRLETSSAARRTIFERSANRCAVFGRRANISSFSLSAGCKVIGFFGRPVRMIRLLEGLDRYTRSRLLIQ